MFKYIAFRVFEFYSKKNNSTPLFNTLIILYFYQITLMLYLLTIFNKLNVVDKIAFDTTNTSYIGKYLFAAFVSLFFFIFNRLVYGSKLQGEKYKNLYTKYHKTKYRINIMVIFFALPFLVFVVPILISIITGTGHFVKINP